MGTILCVGALTMDTIFLLDRLPSGPGKLIPLDAVEVAEGMAAAQAATVARLGGQVALWASAGDDSTGDRLISQISAEGVDCSRVRRVAGGRSAFSSIFMDRTGSTMIVPRYDPAITFAPNAAPNLDGIAAVMTDVRWAPAAALALEAARQRGIPAILDADMASRDVLETLLPLATHIVASESASQLVTGTTSPAAAAASLADRFGVFVAVTAGGDGCFWTDGSAITHSPAPSITPVDTLAAGDVFHGAFAYGLVEGWDMARIIRFASATAAIKCTRFGGRLGAPGRAEVEAFMEAMP